MLTTDAVRGGAWSSNHPYVVQHFHSSKARGSPLLHVRHVPQSGMGSPENREIMICLTPDHVKFEGLGALSLDI